MTQSTSNEGVLTLAEVAAYLKVTERTIYRLASAKKIPAFKAFHDTHLFEPRCGTVPVLTKLG